MKELKDTVAVVTGAASGLGLAMAERFAKEGMRLVLADIDDKALTEVGNRLDAGGTAVQTLRTDVSKQSQIEALADLAFERFGQVNVLCNNAGVAVVGSAWERSARDWEWAINVNLWSVVHGLRAFVPRMLEQGLPGHIVNTSSVAGLLCPPLSAPYVATKHAVVGLSESVHHDLRLRDSKINVSVLCPGFVKTRIVASERARPDDLKDAVPKSRPRVQDVADYFAKAVDNGIEPQVVADAVLDAILNERFYILTHPELTPALRQRFDGIVEQRNPEARPLADTLA